MPHPLIAVIQLPYSPVTDTRALRATLLAAIQPAVAQGAHLVVLPQYSGTMLPSDCTEECFLALCADIAAHCAIWFVPGTIFATVAGQCYARAFVLSSEGQLAGSHCQTHLGVLESQRGLARGESLEVIRTPLGNLGLLIGEEVRYPEVSRILALQGANLLIHLAATPAPFHEEAWLASLWREVQANQLFGAAAYLVGEYAGVRYAGRSALFAPVEMTTNGNGILAQARTVDAGEVVIARADHEALSVVKHEYPVFRFFNDALYAQEFPVRYRDAGGVV